MLISSRPNVNLNWRGGGENAHVPHTNLPRSSHALMTQHQTQKSQTYILAHPIRGRRLEKGARWRTSRWGGGGVVIVRCWWWWCWVCDVKGGWGGGGCGRVKGWCFLHFTNCHEPRLSRVPFQRTSPKRPWTKTYQFPAAPFFGDVSCVRWSKSLEVGGSFKAGN